MDSLEAFQVKEIAVSDGFCVLSLSDGRVMSWGKNDMGQVFIVEE